MYQEKSSFIILFDTSDFSIKEDNGRDQIDTTLKHYGQIDTIKRLKSKLIYGVKDKDQLYNLPYILSCQLGFLYLDIALSYYCL